MTSTAHSPGRARVTTTVRLDLALRDRLAAAAFAGDVSMNEIIVGALNRELPE